MVTTALAAGFALVALSCVRHVVLVRKTTRLCATVERAADERRRLLADVLAHIDQNRRRAAVHAYRQAVSLHTANALLARALAPASGPGTTVAAPAADRMRRDLARQTEWLRQLVSVVDPRGDHGPGTGRLVAPIRAYVANLYGDEPRPDLTLDADPDLDPDWTTEVVAIRIVQEAIDNVRQHARASSIGISFTAPHHALEIEVRDDGAGFDPAAMARPSRESGLATAQALAELVGGRLEVVSLPGRGTRVRATLGREALAPTARPDLRLVRGERLALGAR